MRPAKPPQLVALRMKRQRNEATTAPTTNTPFSAREDPKKINIDAPSRDFSATIITSQGFSNAHICTPMGAINASLVCTEPEMWNLRTKMPKKNLRIVVQDRLTLSWSDVVAFGAEYPTPFHWEARTRSPELVSTLWITAPSENELLKSYGDYIIRVKLYSEGDPKDFAVIKQDQYSPGSRLKIYFYAAAKRERILSFIYDSDSANRRMEHESITMGISFEGISNSKCTDYDTPQTAVIDLPNLTVPKAKIAHRSVSIDDDDDDESVKPKRKREEPKVCRYHSYEDVLSDWGLELDRPDSYDAEEKHYRLAIAIFEHVAVNLKELSEILEFSGLCTLKKVNHYGDE